MVTQKTQQAFEAIAEGLLGGTQAQTDTLEASQAEKEQDLQKANAIEPLSAAGQNITNKIDQNMQFDKDRDYGMA